MKLPRSSTLGFWATLLVASASPAISQAVMVPGNTGRIEFVEDPEQQGRYRPSGRHLEQDEVWIQPSQRSWEEFLRTADLPVELKNELRSLSKPLSSYLETSNTHKVAVSLLGTWSMNPDLAARMVAFTLPRRLRERLPKEFLASAYRYQHEMINYRPYNIALRGEAEISRFIRTRGLTPEQATEFRKLLILSEDGLSRFYVNPSTAHALSRDAIERIQTELDTIQHGQAPELVLGDEADLEATARKYAGDRRHEPLLRYLRRLRQIHGPGEMWVPLRSVLHSFVRKRVHTEVICEGPNCANTARNVNRRPGDQRLEHEWNGVLDDISSRYRAVPQDESLRPGDYLLYATPSGQIVHAVSFAESDLVFTKNGMLPGPIMFETFTEVTRTYFSGEDYLLYAFRPTRPGETPVGPIRADMGPHADTTVLNMDRVTPYSGSPGMVDCTQAQLQGIKRVLRQRPKR